MRVAGVICVGYVRSGPTGRRRGFLEGALVLSLESASPAKFEVTPRRPKRG